MSKEDSILDQELNEKITQLFSEKIEKTVNSVIKKFPNEDSRVELTVVLLSFAAQVAQDMGIDVGGFSILTKSIYEETLEDSEEDDEEYDEEDSVEDVTDLVRGYNNKQINKKDLN